MKRLSFFSISLVLLILCSGIVTAKPKKVKVTPGSLSNLVSVRDFRHTDELEISGVLNNSDIIVLRELCGADSSGNKTTSYVRSLNLKNVKFENSGAPYFVRYSRPYSVSSANVLPRCFLYGTAVEELVLPVGIDTLGAFSLSSASLKRIDIGKNVVLEQFAVFSDSLLSELNLPDMREGLSPAQSKLPALKSVCYGNLDYMPSGSFKDMSEIEEVVFDGMIGHIDGYMFSNCPNLRRVVFNGPVLSTGGEVFASNCPQLEEVEVNSVFVDFGLTKYPDCPKMTGIKINGGIISSYNDAAPTVDMSELKVRSELVEGILKLADWQQNHFKEQGFMKLIISGSIAPMVGLLDSIEYAERGAEMDSLYRVSDPDYGKSNLQILKESAQYSHYAGTEDFTVTYAQPSDSLLTRTREYFNLDSIAGRGDDVTRIKNLLYWVHDLVRHDGGSAYPSCRKNLIDLYELCRNEDRGLNCRFMAIMLTEALLAEGIPARYITCQSKAYETDPDCHVITVAWSDSLQKWIWVDPTFAAFVTDESGLLLHPGEVRYRLQNDLPLVLNDDANWNHQQMQTKEDYLEDYMAKNLYVMSMNLIQQSEPEGESSHVQGRVLGLAPDGFIFMHANDVIPDDSIFWFPPLK